MPGRWKLSRSEERTWTRSNAIAAVRVPRDASWTSHVRAIDAALAAADRARVQAASQHLIDALCAALRVPPLRVDVQGVRPRDGRGELHGLYTPAAGCSDRDRVQVWMHTARRQQVVAFKTFLRTLLHELCHHLDYEHLKLDRSFHTDGFYKRESSLMYAVMPATTTSARSTAR